MARPPLVPPGPELTARERTRYARHLLLPDLGSDGQRRLRAARVLVVGAGGLGSPALLYLAAAGVGTIGVVDDDVVDTTNLQRQVVHGVADVGRAKTESAADAVHAISPDTQVVAAQRAARRGHRARRGRRLRPRARRRRQLPDPLPRGRRVRPARGAARVGLGLPLRRPGVGVVGGRGALLRLRVPAPAAGRRRALVRRGRGARRGLRQHRVGDGDRGRQARHRHRRAARRPAARARRAAADLGRGARRRRPRMPGVRLGCRRHPPARLGDRRPGCRAGADGGARRRCAAGRRSTWPGCTSWSGRASSTGSARCCSTSARRGSARSWHCPAGCG